MRTYYGSDKKRREDAKKKQREEKRLKRLNKNAAAKGSPEPGSAPDAAPVEPETLPESNTKS